MYLTYFVSLSETNTFFFKLIKYSLCLPCSKNKTNDLLEISQDKYFKKLRLEKISYMSSVKASLTPVHIAFVKENFAM